ncbi:hypothetical protein JCM10908_006677 [Rhodotorula pacifica]|uniref:uncharacterized protein n=1 Tax=Rhodotorula pacifica TaxID=1495444 RepID=UPI0031825431
MSYTSSSLPMGADHATPHQSSFGTLTLAGVLDDLAARFIVNLPPDELESMDRVCFQIEQAHWYYEDFIRPNASNPSALPSYNLKAFSLLMFKSCPLLHDLVPQHARIWTSFMQYKERVPVCGAVLINEWWDKVLLVKGWSKGSAWSFPRGKINKEEPEAMCAVREVLEETGFDLTPYFPPAQLHPSYIEPEGSERVPYYVELVIREQKIRLYFVPGIKESTRFETRTRKEISKIDWFRLSDLPTWDRDANHRKGKAGAAGTTNVSAGSARSKGELANGRQAKFYMVTPFISHLKLWIDRNKPKNIPARPSNPNSPLPQPAYVAPEHAQRDRHSHHQNHHQFPNGRQLQPWSEDDSTNHLPSDSELTESTEEGDDFDEDAFEAQRREVEQGWTTTQQGTDALQALFFGAGGGAGNEDVTLRSFPAPDDSPLAPPPPLHAFTLGHVPSEPLRPLPASAAGIPNSHPPSHQSSQLSTPNSTHSHSTLHATPPQVAYERQQSFVQPKPKQSQNQQTRLLDLLTGSAATPPPPTAAAQPVASGMMTVEALEQQVNHLASGALGNLTLDTPSPMAQQLPLPAHLPTSSSSSYGAYHQPSPASLPPPHSSLSSYAHAPQYPQQQPHGTGPHADLFSPPALSYAGSSAPPAAVGGATPVFVSDLEDSQKQEKRDALLRALLSVAAKSPPKPPPRELEPHQQDKRWFVSPSLQHAEQPGDRTGAGNGVDGGGSLLSILNGSSGVTASTYNHHTPQPAPQHSTPYSSAPLPAGSSYPNSQLPPPPLQQQQQYPSAYGSHLPQQHQSAPPPMVPIPSYPPPPPQNQYHHPQQYAQPPFQQPGMAPQASFLPSQQLLNPSASTQHLRPQPHPSYLGQPQPQNPQSLFSPPIPSPATHGLPPMPPMPPPVPIVPHPGGPATVPQQGQQQSRGKSGQLLGLLNGRS